MSISLLNLNTVNFKQLFTGAWTFTRHVSTPAVVITGIARFEETVSGVLYTEDGAYRLHNECQTCFQTYVYHTTPNTFAIVKNDGVLLHEGRVEEGATFPAALHHQHICKNDVYACQWVFHDNDAFDVSYTIKGPKKDYHIFTTFIRD